MSNERPGKVAGLYLSWHRCVADGRDHAVIDEQFLAGMQARQGRYETVCGHVLNAESLLFAPGTPCARCHTYLAALASLRDVAARMAGPRHRKGSSWRRLFARSCTPIGVGRTEVPSGTVGTPIALIPAGRHALRGAR
ncbi:hypothetical protein [Amycolatopsis sp. NPDC051716]|uniref:hypothetical protein n=1 Tax=Amycolatopsis sp. NPDC051716 TaxID=3155804 RepID=UPI0034343D1B